MTSATLRRDSSLKQFQKRVPNDVLAKAAGRTYPITFPAIGASPELSVVVTIRKVIKLSLRVRDPADAKRRVSFLTEQLERIFDSVRSGPVDLDHKTAVALSGEIYRLVRAQWEREPGAPEDWEPWKAFTWAAIEGRVANPPAASWQSLMTDRHAAMGDFGISGGPGLLDAIERLPPGDNARSLELRFGLMGTWVLAKHGLEVTPSSRLKLLRQVAEAALDAGWAMKRAAQGNYAPDANAERFPALESNLSAPSATLTELFEGWRLEASPAPSTLQTWKPVVASLREHIGSDHIARVTAQDVIGWKDSLRLKGLSSKTINDTYLACIRALLAHGVRNGVLKENAAIGISVKHKRIAGTGKLPYEDSEVAMLLALASKEKHPIRRWIPLLAACTGARAGELAQLWAERVRVIDGVPSMELRPAEDGGTFKNLGSERVVPLHPELLEAGFLTFVEEKKRGPLFYGRASGKGGRHASKGTVNRVAEWIRKQPGFDNPRKQPNHAFRHWWKSTASRIDIPDSRADAIQGHAPRNVGGHYRHFDLKTLAKDVARIPIPKLEP